MSSYCLWSQWEFKTLLLVLVDLDVRRRLSRGVERCPKIFKEVALELARHGVQKSEKQALQKFRNLKTSYKHFAQRKENGFPVNSLPLQDLQEKVFGTLSEMSCARGPAREEKFDVSMLHATAAAAAASCRNALQRTASVGRLVGSPATAAGSGLSMSSHGDHDSDSAEFSLPLSVQLEVTSEGANGFWNMMSNRVSSGGVSGSGGGSGGASVSRVADGAEMMVEVDVSTGLSAALSVMRQQQQLLDVTLVCDGRSLMAHRVLLAAHSPLLSRLLVDHPSKHPIIIMRDTPHRDMNLLLDLMYSGQSVVPSSHIHSVWRTARSLQLTTITSRLQSEMTAILGSDGKPATVDSAIENDSEMTAANSMPVASTATMNGSGDNKHDADQEDDGDEASEDDEDDNDDDEENEDNYDEDRSHSLAELADVKLEPDCGDYTASSPTDGLSPRFNHSPSAAAASVHVGDHFILPSDTASHMQ